MPVIVAKRESRCTACQDKILIGERINFTRATGAQHLVCGDDRDDPEDEIRTAYDVWRTAGHLQDAQAFDECVQEFGYVPTVKALYQVSTIAKTREDAYQARRPRNSTGMVRFGGRRL